MSELVTLAEEENYCLITMDDGKANALGFDMLGGLNSALDEAEKTGKVVIITGRPGKFSAGFDLSVMARLDNDTARLLHLGAGMSGRLLNFPVPVIIAASGHALAMGALLTLSADYRIGIEGSYKLGLNEVAIGMTLPWFGIHLARERLNKSHLHRAVSLAETFDATGAVEAGILDEAVDEEALLPRAIEVAQRLATLDMQAHAATKARLREPLNTALENAMDEFPLLDE